MGKPKRNLEDGGSYSDFPIIVNGQKLTAKQCAEFAHGVLRNADDWQNITIDGGTLPEVIVTPTNDASWLFSDGKFKYNPRKPLADKHTRKVVSNYLSKFDNESAEEYNARISRLADVLDIRGVQFKKNDVKSGKLKGRAHYIDQYATAYIDSMEDIFAEVAHPWQYAKGNNNIEEEVGVGTYDSDNDPRGGTRYAYPDTAEGETHSFFEPTLTEWIETGKISRTSPILNEQLSKQKIVPKNRMEVADSAASWNRKAIDKRLLADPKQLPISKRIKYSIFDYPLLIKKSSFRDGGSINIKPSKRGTFTAAANKRHLGVQAFASRVLANKENYSPTMVKKANFARNASKWH